MIWHPDRFPPDSALNAEAQEKIKAINEAYHFLLDNPRPEDPPKPVPPPPRTGNAPAGGSGFSPVFWLTSAGLVALAGIALVLGSPSPSPTPPGLELGLPGSGQPLPQPPPRPETKAPSLLIADLPGVVVFSPSQKELDESSAIQAATIAKFLEEAQGLLAKIHRLRPGLRVEMTDAEDIWVRGEIIHRSQTCGFGYVLSAPPKPPKLLEGLQGVDEMLESVTELFPKDDSGIKPE